MRYMIIERFKPGAIHEVYRRFDERGRMMPTGLNYIDSWVSTDLHTCYQLMETNDFNLFRQWTSMWDDLVEFQIEPVISSSEARCKATARPQA